MFIQRYRGINSNIPRLWRRSTCVCCNTKVVTFRFAISCVVLRPIEKRNTRSFLNRRLLRFYNWHLNVTGVQYCHAQYVFSCARVHPRVIHRELRKIITKSLHLWILLYSRDLPIHLQFRLMTISTAAHNFQYQNSFVNYPCQFLWKTAYKNSWQYSHKLKKYWGWSTCIAVYVDNNRSCHVCR